MIGCASDADWVRWIPGGVVEESLSVGGVQGKNEWCCRKTDQQLRLAVVVQAPDEVVQGVLYGLIGGSRQLGLLRRRAGTVRTVPGCCGKSMSKVCSSIGVLLLPCARSW